MQLVNVDAIAISSLAIYIIMFHIIDWVVSVIKPLYEFRKIIDRHGQEIFIQRIESKINKAKNNSTKHRLMLIEASFLKFKYNIQKTIQIVDLIDPQHLESFWLNYYCRFTLSMFFTNYTDEANKMTVKLKSILQKHKKFIGVKLCFLVMDYYENNNKSKSELTYLLKRYKRKIII